jgi:DNA-binding NarL/FixJ family response regulator
LVLGTLAALRPEDLRSATQFIEQLLAGAQARGELAETAECCFYLAGAYYWLAEMTRALAVSEQRIALMERCQQPHHLRTAYTWQVLLFSSQGRWTEAEPLIARAYTLVETLTDPIPSAFLHQIRGFLAYQREDYLLAERELQTAQVDQSLQSGLGDMMFYLGLLGFVQAVMGKEEEARAYMTRLETQLALLPVGILPTAPLLICLALTALTLQDEKPSKDLYPHLLLFHGQHHWFLVDRILGMLALHDGQWEAAAEHLSAAEATAQREELRPELARTLLAKALVELAQGGQGSIMHAEELLREALALFEELGMAHSARYTLSRLSALSSCPGRRAHAAFPAHLTEREVAVLKLVVQGKSNREIAHDLGLSEKTITNYLTHIFNKTTCENRAAATAFAIRHGLA